MITGHDIICIASIDWDFIWQVHQELMSLLARRGNRVLFIENTGVRTPTPHDLPRLMRRLTNWFKGLKGFRNVQDRLWVYSPVILPFPYSRVARRINRRLLLTSLRRWMWATGFHDPIIWTFLPTGIALDLITHLNPQLVVYHCIADFEKLVSHPKKVQRTEAQVVRQSDLVFVQGEAFEAKCRKWNEHVSVFPTGVNLGAFVSDGEQVPEDVRAIPRPVIGYVGGLHRHVDVELLRDIAHARPDWSIVLIGPEQRDLSALDGTPNVFRLGEKSYPEIPQYLRAFDVGLIPYRQSAYTETVSPSKLHEYHAVGKPVVSTALPEMAAFNQQHGPLIRLAEDVHQCVAAIRQALEERDPVLAQRRMAIARENTWERRLEEMSRLIEQRLVEKGEAVPKTWQERLAGAYQRVRRRTVAIGAACALVYLALCHTPLVWWMAKPLAVAQPPRPADAIVVFAGGVGESGQAGQGYEERVQYAVELYRQGLGNRVIFSSGYVYAMKEAQVMKALAVSLGVPAEAILLEEQASNTYENVLFSATMMRRQGLRSAVVVSSPYHMRRVELVWRHAAPDLSATWSPIPDSLFFGDHSTVQMKHLHAILHEYLALGYYWCRGYL